MPYQLIENKQIRSGRKISNRYNNNVTKIGGVANTNKKMRIAAERLNTEELMIKQAEEGLRREKSAREQRESRQNKRANR